MLIGELSYAVHTNRELELMLKGEKPLAYFSDVIFDDQPMPEANEEFERHVEIGTFVKHEVREDWQPGTVNGRVMKGRWTRYYALKDEAWRIPAFMLLRQIAGKHRWSDALERLQGSLLGYTEAQNDEWLAKHAEHHAGWACITLYALVPQDVLSGIDDLGMKALPMNFLAESRLFVSEKIPSSAALDEAGLSVTDDGFTVVRFGIETPFFMAHCARASDDRLAEVIVRDGVEVRTLNRSLRTDIQVIRPL